MKYKYVSDLKNGKKIRIKNNKPTDDYCGGWWQEELWEYDKENKNFRCYYPVSSYEKDFYTTLREDQMLSYINETLMSYADVNSSWYITDIIVEDVDKSSCSLFMKALAIEKINQMTDEELKRKLDL